jgi:hypothetical protein
MSDSKKSINFFGTCSNGAFGCQAFARERGADSGLPGIAKLLQIRSMTGGHLGDAGVTKKCHPVDINLGV